MYGNIGFCLGNQLGGRIADPNTGWYSKLDYQLHRVAWDCDVYWHLGPDEFAEGMVVLQ